MAPGTLNRRGPRLPPFLRLAQTLGGSAESRLLSQRADPQPCCLHYGMVSDQALTKFGQDSDNTLSGHVPLLRRNAHQHDARHRAPLTQGKVSEVLVHGHQQPILRYCKFQNSGVVSGRFEVLDERDIVSHARRIFAIPASTHSSSRRRTSPAQP